MVVVVVVGGEGRGGGGVIPVSVHRRASCMG
jgi:hypothetical protein